MQIFTVWNCVMLNYTYLQTPQPTYLITYLLYYLLTYLLTKVLTPWNRVLLEKLTVSQTVKKFPAFNGTRNAITAFTGAHNLSLSLVRSIQTISHHSTSLFLFYMTPPSTSELSKWSLSLRFPTKSIHAPLFSHIRYTCFFHVILPDFITRNVLGEKYRSLS